MSGLSIFREVWGGGQGYQAQVRMWPARAALVAGFARVACFPMDAVHLRSNHVLPLPDCARWPRFGSRDRIVLVCANVVQSRVMLVYRNDSHVPVQNASHTTERLVQFLLVDLVQCKQTNCFSDRARYRVLAVGSLE